MQHQRLYAVPVIGGIFCVVLSLQSLQWARASQRLAGELFSSDRGCVSRVTSVQNTALDFWATAFYAVELQSRKPRTVLLPGEVACRLFALNGEAMLVDQGSFIFVRQRGEGWFDLEDARTRTIKPGNRLVRPSKKP